MNAYRSQIPILERELEALTEQCAELEAQAARKAANIEHQPVFQQSILKGNRQLAIFTLMAALVVGRDLVHTPETLDDLVEGSRQCHAVLTEQADEVAGSARAIAFRETCRALCSAKEASPPVVTEHEDNTESSEMCQ